MKKLFLILPVLFFSLFLMGHEFWLQPDKFIYQPGETVNLRFRMGENFDGNNWTGSKSRVKSMIVFFENYEDSCTKNISSTQGDSLQLVMADAGTVMLAMLSDNPSNDLKADEFNDYLEENGLQNVLEARTKNNQLKKAVKTNFQRCAKTIIQVGAKNTNTFKKQTGMVIDIIPKEHPYAIAKDGDFKVKVMYKGKPLKNAMVKVWHRLNNKVTSKNLQTDEEGEVKFFISTKGLWMVSAVQMQPAGKADANNADWQSYQGSLTWGYTK